MAALAKEHTSANLVGAIERHGMGGAIESTPTKELREELERKAIPIPEGEVLKELSAKMNAWLEKFRSDIGLGHSVTWHNLFTEVD